MKIEVKIIDKTGKYTYGLCDNCKCPEMINTGGDGVHEPAYEDLYCKKKKIFIEPQPLENQVKECDGFDVIVDNIHDNI